MRPLAEGVVGAGVFPAGFLVAGDVLAAPGDALANRAGAADLAGRIGVVPLRLRGARPDEKAFTRL